LQDSATPYPSNIMRRAVLLLALVHAASAHPVVDAWRAQANALRHANARSRTVKSPQTAKPAIPKVWSATVLQRITLDGKALPFTGSAGRQTSDATARRSISQGGSKVPYAPLSFVGTPLEWLNQTQYADNEFTGIDLENTKYPGNLDQSSGFHDLFAWTIVAKLVGTVGSYHRWEYSIETPYSASFVLLTSLDDTTPVQFLQNITMTQPGKGTVKYDLNYTFFDFTTGTAPWAVELWSDFNRSDFTDPMVCPTPQLGAVAEPATQEHYIFHPRHEFNISAQDNGDANGDVYFTCQDLLTNQSQAMGEDYQWISHWSITLIPRWGQYQNCNNYGAANNCLGNEHFWVGHEAALGMGEPDGGQCVTNPLVGEWFSLPVGGQCADGVAPDGKACTWVATRQKTIDAQCLLGHKYIEACLADGRAPFEQAKAKFLAAFGSEDPAQGGCPGLPGPAGPRSAAA